ncbi:uncharacterized protein CANTADRAFT_22518 [Suhomyces tanzawaensis NRRL Y-17324]|uniref:Large ribosomal subunit protein mL67 n=1 Tax=Suhomyces tanzawaensis NRRL Y-17324 TaxID=984487 RepID=A0A1E4SGD5_9ASCO|nr:uncharacterized protein CANTADRAFT_22518 [Suhomyces tanzawaensis NRRL Y-17324]ODV78530.1 hypothetical protein CANTADRAFT_22518 [Suhomyces tanzawaensis NRRL Y-17324]
MPMRLRAEKKMRKLLIEHLKTRKVLGARIAKEPKTAQDLEQLGLAPQVYMFKNLFSGQVLYSQVPAFHQTQIDEQFPRPNWENRKPSRRNDLWRVMCVATFDNYEYALAAYKGLVQLRQARDVFQQKEAKSLRRKDNEGNTWYSGQYRPTYSQEAVADLAHVVDEFELANTKLQWENLWRKGEDQHWRLDLVEHDSLPPFNPRDQSILLDDLRARAVQEFAKLREAEAVEKQVEESVVA